MHKRFTGFMSIMVLISSSSVVAQVLPDPTRPADYQTNMVVQDLPQELMDWKVTVIRISETDRSALVNGKLVRVGDVIGRAKILEIQSLQVILGYANRQVAVRLISEEIKRTKSGSDVPMGK